MKKFIQWIRHSFAYLTNQDSFTKFLANRIRYSEERFPLLLNQSMPFFN